MSNAEVGLSPGVYGGHWEPPVKLTEEEGVLGSLLGQGEIKLK